MKNLYAKIRSGATVAMLANIIYLISRIALTPFILSYVSLSAYGLWTFCFVVLSYAGMSAFGIHNSYIKYTAEYFHTKEYHKINGLYSTGLLIMGAYSAAFFVALTIASPWIVGLFDIEAGLVPLAKSLLIGTASVFLIDLTLGAFRAILEGMQEIAISKSIWLAATLLEVLLVVLFLHAGTGLIGVMYAYIIKTLVDVIAHIVLAYRFLPSLHIAISLVNKRYYHELFVFGGKVQVLGLLGMFLGSLDRILITAIFGLNATGLYELGRKLPFTARSITGAASAPFLPAASAMKGIWKSVDNKNIDVTKNESKLKIYYNKLWNYTSLLIVTIFMGILSITTYLTSKFYIDNLFILNKNQFLQTKFYNKILHYDFYNLSMHNIISILETNTIAQFSLVIFIILSVIIFILSIIKQYNTLKTKEYYDAPELSTFYIQASRYINMINAVIYGFIMATAPQLLYAWLGDGYGIAHNICLIIGLMCIIHLATLPCSAIMRGINRSGRELEAIIINVILFVIWAPFLCIEYNFIGIVWAFALSTIASSIFFIIRTNYVFNISSKKYIKECIYPILFPSTIAIAIAYIFTVTKPYLEILNRWEILILLAGTGALYIGACCALLWFTCLNHNECSIITNIFKRKK